MNEPTDREKLGELPHREGDEVTGMAALRVIEGGNQKAEKKVTGKAALELLQGGAASTEDVKKHSGAALEIAGQEIIDTQKAYANLREALALVKKHMGKKFDIRLEEIFFKKLPGEQVGESTESGEEIDPILLLHPAMRLAHVIAHEMAHNKKRIMNEAVVEAYVHLWFGEDNAEHGYEKAIEKYEEFAKKFAKNGDKKTGVKEIYELYYVRNFDKIYDRHVEVLSVEKRKKKGWRAALTEDERDEAYISFREIFPELNFRPVTKHGSKLELKQLEEPKEDNVADFDDYRKKISETEAQVRKRA